MKRFSKKDKIIEYLKRCNGNVSMACELVGISVTEYNDLRKADLVFAERVDYAIQFVLDDIESCLMNSAKRGNVTAQMFILKNRKKEIYAKEKAPKEDGIKDEFKKMSREELIKSIKQNIKDL